MGLAARLRAGPQPVAHNLPPSAVPLVGSGGGAGAPGGAPGRPGLPRAQPGGPGGQRQDRAGAAGRAPLRRPGQRGRRRAPSRTGSSWCRWPTWPPVSRPRRRRGASPGPSPACWASPPAGRADPLPPLARALRRPGPAAGAGQPGAPGGRGGGAVGAGAPGAAGEAAGHLPRPAATAGGVGAGGARTAGPGRPGRPWSGPPRASSSCSRPARGRSRPRSATRSAPPSGRRSSDICRLTGGLPLSLVLAAAWSPVLSFAEIAAELGAAVDVPETSLRGLPARQRRVSDVLGAAWDQLAGRRIRPCCAGCPSSGGASPARRRGRWSGASPQQLLRLLDLFLVSPGDGGRYQLDEVVHRYATRQQAGRPEERAAIGARHAAYFAGLRPAAGAGAAALTAGRGGDRERAPTSWPPGSGPRPRVMPTSWSACAPGLLLFHQLSATAAVRRLRRRPRRAPPRSRPLLPRPRLPLPRRRAGAPDPVGPTAGRRGSGA